MSKSPSQNIARTWVEVLLMVLAGLACATITRKIASGPISRLVALISFFAPAAIFVLVVMVRSKSIVVPEDDRIVALEEFLRDSDAIIAPNFPEFRKEIIQWVRDFAERNGPKSVFVEVQRDESHISDRLFFVGRGLGQSERNALMDFSADVRPLSARNARRLFGELNLGSVTKVEWD